MTISSIHYDSLSTSVVTTMITSTDHHQITSSYYITYSSPPGGSSSGSSSDSDSGAIYAAVAAVACFGFLIVLSVVTIIIIMVIKKQKRIRQSQQNTRFALATLPQPPSTQTPVCTQQTSRMPNINEDTLASGNPQPAASYPFSYGTEDTTVESINNSSVLPDGAINPPPYSACIGEHAPDGSTDNQVKLLPPDYASIVTS